MKTPYDTYTSKIQRQIDKSVERVLTNPKNVVLSKIQQVEDVFANARIVLRLECPEDVFDEEERQLIAKRDAQKMRDFADTLESHLVNEHGVCLIAVFACEF